MLANLDVAARHVGEFYPRIALGEYGLALVNRIARAEFAGMPVGVEHMRDAAERNDGRNDGA
jgi:hypothetical protein